VRSRRSEWVMKKYRKEADKLFMGKKGTKKHQKAHNDIDRYHGTDQFEATVKAYLDQYGLPDDWSTLSLLLDYSDPEKVLQALAAMKDLYETRSPIEKQGFKAKVDILAMTASDSDLEVWRERCSKPYRLKHPTLSSLGLPPSTSLSLGRFFAGDSFEGF